MMDQPPIRIALVVDDHPITHLGCGRLLADHRPEAVVLDIALPGPGGLSLIGPILERSPGSSILMFSMNDQPGFAARALEAGAQGFLSKNVAPEEFNAAIRALEAGEFYLSPAQALALATRRAGAEGRAGLTDREDQVLAFLDEGRSLQEIADRLGVSYKTVANATSTLKRKLGVANMAGLIRHALERG